MVHSYLLCISRLCYFTCESTNRKVDWLKEINWAYHGSLQGGLMCSFTDKEVSEFIQAKKRSCGPLTTKRAVSMVGRQANGSWVLNNNLIVGPDGKEVSIDESPYIWISHLLEGPGLAKPADAINIELPLCTEPLKPLTQALRSILQHNFFPGLLVVGACIMSTHYSVIMGRYLNCPVAIAFGESGTGKTTALRCGLSVVGAYPNRFFSRGTKEKYLELCSNSSIPIGIDDPSVQKDVDSLILDLFNGAKSGSISRGEKKPSTTAVIAANFTTTSKEK